MPLQLGWRAWVPGPSTWSPHAPVGLVQPVCHRSLPPETSASAMQGGHTARLRQTCVWRANASLGPTWSPRAPVGLVGPVCRRVLPAETCASATGECACAMAGKHVYLTLTLHASKLHRPGVFSNRSGHCSNVKISNDVQGRNLSTQPFTLEQCPLRLEQRRPDRACRHVMPSRGVWTPVKGRHDARPFRPTSRAPQAEFFQPTATGAPSQTSATRGKRPQSRFVQPVFQMPACRSHPRT